MIRASKLESYSPANHTGTRNARLVGPKANGAKPMEIALGEIERGAGAPLPAHPGLEQAAHVLEGEAIAEIDGVPHAIGAGDPVYFRGP